jgi:hypothetical protein
MVVDVPRWMNTCPEVLRRMRNWAPAAAVNERDERMVARDVRDGGAADALDARIALAIVRNYAAAIITTRCLVADGPPLRPPKVTNAALGPSGSTP